MSCKVIRGKFNNNWRNTLDASFIKIKVNLRWRLFSQKYEIHFIIIFITILFLL